MSPPPATPLAVLSLHLLHFSCKCSSPGRGLDMRRTVLAAGLCARSALYLEESFGPNTSGNT